jgi:hypothetical protein
LSRYRKKVHSPAFSLIDTENAFSPIQVIEAKLNNLTDAKSKMHHTNCGGIVAKSGRTILVKGAKNRGKLDL